MTTVSEGATVIRAARLLDVVASAVSDDGAAIVVEGDRITAVNPESTPRGATEIDLGDVTLMPGLMDMELNLFLGGPSGGNPRSDVQDDPAFRTLRATVNARKTLLAGFTTVRNLGLFVRTGGVLLDVALSRAVDAGWVDGPRIVPAGHAISPTGGHLDPTMFSRFGPGIMPLSVEEGIANGVSEVRAAVRYQLKYGARLIKVSASGGVMSHSGESGAQQYSDEELAAIADEAHRAGVKVAAHCHGDGAARACIEAGIDCLEHGFLINDDTLALMAERGTFLVSTTCLADQMDLSRAAPELIKKAEEVFPRARTVLSRAERAGVRICCGTDAPAIPHGDGAKELESIVSRGLSPMTALRAATVTSAELIGREDDLGQIEPGYLADIIAVPGNPADDITVTQDVRFVMK
ncbi:MAG TPA: amidohydrolase family protein, partial [Mycobacteriales bacterium]|nr:amidohydrolase family protein [Mycobacteriales bacterium]